MRGKNHKELLEIKDNAHYIKNSMKAYKNNVKPRWQTELWVKVGWCREGKSTVVIRVSTYKMSPNQKNREKQRSGNYSRIRTCPKAEKHVYKGPLTTQENG